MGTIKRTLAALVAAGAAVMAAAGPAHAGVLVASAKNCNDSGPASRVFAPWLDPASYVLASGGDLESAGAWELRRGAGVVAGNEPWKVGGGNDGKSLALPTGSSATTGATCVGLGHPTVRFFARKTGGGLLSTLLVEVEFEGLGGALKSLPIAVVVGGSQWQPTLPYPVIANLLPLLPGAQTPVAFRFTPILGGSWQVDDVYVDPFKAR